MFKFNVKTRYYKEVKSILLLILFPGILRHFFFRFAFLSQHNTQQTQHTHYSTRRRRMKKKWKNLKYGHKSFSSKKGIHRTAFFEQFHILSIYIYRIFFRNSSLFFDQAMLLEASTHKHLLCGPHPWYAHSSYILSGMCRYMMYIAYLSVFSKVYTNRPLSTVKRVCTRSMRYINISFAQISGIEVKGKEEAKKKKKIREVGIQMKLDEIELSGGITIVPHTCMGAVFFCATFLSNDKPYRPTQPIQPTHTHTHTHTPMHGHAPKSRPNHMCAKHRPLQPIHHAPSTTIDIDYTRTETPVSGETEKKTYKTEHENRKKERKNI